jgi:hypothetical protein
MATFGQDQFLVSAQVGQPGTDGFVDLGTFAQRSGGEKDSDTQQVYKGGMQPAEARPGRPTRSNITLTKPFEYGDGAKIAAIDPRVGRAPIKCTSQPLDADGNPFGRGFVWTGILKGLTTPEHDAASTDNATWSLVIETSTTMGSVNT